MIRLFLLSVCLFSFDATLEVFAMNFRGNIGFICAAISVKTHKSQLSIYH